MENHQKLKSYQLLIEMVKKTTSTMESDSILQFILNGIIKVLPCVDVGVLFLYEKDKELLKMVATHNITFDDERPYLKPGEGVSGKCFAQKDCLALNSTEAFVNYMDCPSSYMRSFPDSNKEYPHSAMSCTLMVENEAVGVVIVYNYVDENYFFTEDDLELLNAAADHAAITISKSQLIKQKDYYLNQLEESHRALESTVDIQSTFTDIILNNNSFSKVLEYLKSVINGEVFLYDVFFQEIYRTNQNIEINLQQLIDDNNLKINQETQHYQSAYYRINDKLYIISPIIVQKNLIGFLIILMEDKIINKKEEAILNHASLVIALEWLKNDARTKSFSDFSNKFLDSVIKNPVDSNLLIYANKLGVNKDSNFCDSIIHGIVFPREDDIYIIYYSEKPINKMKKEILRNVNKLLTFKNLRLVIGGTYNSLENIVKSYEDCQNSMKLMIEYNTSLKYIDYDSLGIWQLLLKLEKKDLEEYACKLLQNILEEKTEKNNELIMTLQAYSNYNQNIKETAKVLNLHHNTIYFRIKRIEKILGLDFSRKDDWIKIQLACSIIGKCYNY